MQTAKWRHAISSVGKALGTFGALLLLLAGCAEKGPILLSIDYDKPEGVTAVSSAPLVDVSPFVDSRNMEPSVLGERTILSGQKDNFVVQGTVAETVTALLKKAFVARGIAVKQAPSWDLSAEGIKGGAGLLLGGEVKTLRIESKAIALSTNVKTAVQLRIVVADESEKKIIRTIDVNSSVEQDILYSREKLEEVLSEALSSAIDQMFKDEDLQKRLR